MLAFEKEGTGIPLVFIHAFPLSKSMWSEVKKTFSKNFQVVTLDMPGFGDSPLQKDTTNMDDMAREVLSTLDALNIREKFVLSGLSMGGYVIFQMMKQAVDRVRGLVLISTRSTPDTEDIRERRKKTVELIKDHGLTDFAEKMIPNLFSQHSIDLKLPVIDDVRQQILKANPEAICAALKGMALRSDATQYLQNINVPTLVMAGDDDSSISPIEMTQMARLIPRARYEQISRAGHLIPLEQPDLFIDAFSRYLKRSVL